MPGEDVDFKRVSQIYREESRRKTLTGLEPDFYSRLAAYVSELEDLSARETTEDFNSPKAVLLRDELRKVQRKREQIYSIRERKIAMLALAKVGGGPVDTSVLTVEERDLFDRFLGILAEGRETALGAEAPEVVEEPPERPQEESVETADDDTLENHVMVRILEDVPPFAGLDGTYTLRKSDVVSLPRNVADVLMAKGAAAEIRPPR